MPRSLVSPFLMMANETIAHVPGVGFDEMRWNNAWRQENMSAQMVEPKNRYVGHFLLWPSRNTVQMQRRHSRMTSIPQALSRYPIVKNVISYGDFSSNRQLNSLPDWTPATFSWLRALMVQDQYFWSS